MNEQTELHQLIGALRADMASSQRQGQVMFEVISDIAKQLAVLCSDQKVHISNAMRLKNDLEEIEKRVQSLEVMKNRLIGIGLILAAGAGAAWDAVKMLITP